MIVLAIISCTSAPRTPDASAGSLGPIASVSLSDEKKSVVAKLGPPASMNSEKFPSVQYEVLEYSKANGLPAGYISLDPASSKVAGRSVWISEQQPEQEFKYLQGRLFPHAEFETFVTCDKHHADEVRVDRKNGIFISMHKGKVVLVSWADVTLTKLRVELFFLKCPERQQRTQ